jgi:hypothetical protein
MNLIGRQNDLIQKHASVMAVSLLFAPFVLSLTFSLPTPFSWVFFHSSGLAALGAYRIF